MRELSRTQKKISIIEMRQEPIRPPYRQACIGGQDNISTLPNHGELHDHLNWTVNSQ